MPDKLLRDRQRGGVRDGGRGSRQVLPRQCDESFLSKWLLLLPGRQRWVLLQRRRGGRRQPRHAAAVLRCGASRTAGSSTARVDDGSSLGCTRATMGCTRATSGYSRANIGDSRGTLGYTRATMWYTRGTMGARKYPASGRKEALDAAHGWMDAHGLSAWALQLLSRRRRGALGTPPTAWGTHRVLTTCTTSCVDY